MGCKHEEEKTDLMSQIGINSIKDENTEITSSQTTAQNIIESLLQTAEENPARSQEIKPENISETADDRDGNVSTVIEKTVDEIADIVSENLEKQTPDVEESNAMCLDTKDENQQGITTVRNKVDIKLCNVENEDVICNNTIKDDNEFQLNIDTEVQKIPTKEYLLASSARGGSIYIWRAGTDGRKETELFIGGNKNRRWKNTDKSWISLCWIAPDILLSSSPSAELLQWDLLKLNDKRVAQKKLIHHDHNNNLYVIAAPITLIHEWNKDIKRQNLFAWTTGQERYLLNTALQADRTLMASYPTIGGNVYTIRSSPLDPTRLAIGIGDNTAKIWDISRPHKQCITMANLWQKIQSKVLALAWHPKKETILAYATAEGRIGTVNTSSKSPSLLCQYFRNAIYDIHWGPIEGNIENLGLYAVGEGKLVVYNTAAETEDPKLVEPPSKEHIHCLAWKADFSLMACSTKTGSIIIYDISLNHITTIYSEYKSIYCVVWHPLATSQDEGTSSMASWLAISSSCTSVVVFDIPADKTNFEEKNKVAILNRHSRPVRCISWNPFVGGRIVSGGDDGVIFVWDVITQTVLATYLEHNIEPVLTVLWSPLDENFIISAGKDNCIRVWNVNEHKPKSDEEITNAHKIHSLFRYERKQFNKEINGDTEDEPLKVQRHVMLNLTSRAQNTPESVLNDCVRFYKTLNPDENAQLDAGSNLANGFDVLKMFGDKNSMMDLLNAEQKHHEEKKKSCFNQHIELWKGDIAAMVKNSIAQEKVSPWLISLAPMVSPELWKEACDVYAKKLMEDAKSDPLETVSYLLICHKVEEAIEVLCNATLFREALALAKCRLSKNDPIITDILKRWATFGILNGAYEMSTQCYIALGQYEEAAKALFRRTSIDALKFSVTLAEKSGNKDLIDACILRYNNFKNAGEGDESQNAEAMERDEMKDVGEKGDLVEKTEEASSQD